MARTAEDDSRPDLDEEGLDGVEDSGGSEAEESDGEEALSSFR